MNSKVEKILLFPIWLLIFDGLALLLPPQNVNRLVQMQYILAASFITAIIYFLYLKIRNNCIVAKCKQMILANEFNKCIEYLDKCIIKHPKVIWIKFRKLLSLALAGRIVEYEIYSAEVKKLKLKSSEIKLVHEFNNLFSFFKGDNQRIDIDYTGKSRTQLEQINYLISPENGIEESTAMEYAKTIYNSPYALYKTFAAFYLSNIYKSRGDSLNQQMYIDEALKKCPSDEILCCIKTQIGA